MFRFTTIKDYHTALQAGSMSCIQAVNYYLDQIARNENLNAFLEVFTEDAKQRAIALDELRVQNKSTGESLGKLHGVIVGIKDVLCYQGHKVSAASKILENYRKFYSNEEGSTKATFEIVMVLAGRDKNLVILGAESVEDLMSFFEELSKTEISASI